MVAPATTSPVTRFRTVPNTSVCGVPSCAARGAELTGTERSAIVARNATWNGLIWEIWGSGWRSAWPSPHAIRRAIDGRSGEREHPHAVIRRPGSREGAPEGRTCISAQVEFRRCGIRGRRHTVATIGGTGCRCLRQGTWSADRPRFHGRGIRLRLGGSQGVETSAPRVVPVPVLRIPTHAVHRFRRMPSTHSDSCRPPIPRHVVHRFRRMSSTDSEACRPPWSERVAVLAGLW